MVDSIVNSLGHRLIDNEGMTHVSLTELINQSHASDAEYEAFRTRLADLLTTAGRDDHLHFHAQPPAATHYRMLGSAYLVQADGFDQWELFIAISPADRDYTLWRTGHPVRVLRQPRPGQAQVFVPR